MWIQRCYLNLSTFYIPPLNFISSAVCEYYVHGECVDFAAADCKENATFAAGSDPRHVHHWREGNLPANSKCAACRRACWSAECLTGYRCEWCGSTVWILWIFVVRQAPVDIIFMFRLKDPRLYVNKLTMRLYNQRTRSLLFSKYLKEYLKSHRHEHRYWTWYLLTKPKTYTKLTNVVMSIWYGYQI